MRDWDSYFAKVRGPMPPDLVAEYTRDRLGEMRKAGVKWVKLLGCGNPAEDCAECLRRQAQTIPISEAQPLPLPGCDKRFCKCILIAVAKPEARPR